MASIISGESSFLMSARMPLITSGFSDGVRRLSVDTFVSPTSGCTGGKTKSSVHEAIKVMFSGTEFGRKPKLSSISSR